MRWIATRLFATAFVAQATAAETPANIIDLSAAWTPATSRSRAAASATSWAAVTVEKLSDRGL